MSHNYISNISDGFLERTYLAGVVEMDLSFNMIDSIQYQWGLWAKKGDLILAHNKITSIHWDDKKSFERWTSLPHRILDFAEDIVEMSVRALYMFEDPSFSEMIGNFTNLRRLDISYSLLSRLTQSFCGLTKLEYADFTGNNFLFNWKYVHEFPPNCSFPILKVLNHSQGTDMAFSYSTWDMPLLEVMNASRFSYYLPDTLLLMELLESFPSLQTVDLSGAYALNIEEMFKSANYSAATNLTTLEIGNLGNCLSNPCQSNTRVLLNDSEYQTLLQDSNLLTAGFNCTAPPSTKQYVCTR
eukprot:TRINITY_DN7211_c0_g3_i1.p1 TRINITY_DN7211_c0_g3~~TRINITY_DN7211_c0_g3_i1.p1  ORF type:complete len:299 (-),score=66.78 TRINITY_DN7211_c0_g3_i1:21-917(-)